VIDINGKVVLEKNIENPKLIENIDTSSLHSGVYLIALNAGDKRITKRIVIE
jgi:hypothetical protein